MPPESSFMEGEFLKCLKNLIIGDFVLRVVYTTYPFMLYITNSRPLHSVHNTLTPDPCTLQLLLLLAIELRWFVHDTQPACTVSTFAGYQVALDYFNDVFPCTGIPHF